LSDNSSFSDIETVGKMKWLEGFYCYGCNLSKEEIEELKRQLSNCEIGANYK
jgi:predicted CopG family antitoxin